MTKHKVLANRLKNGEKIIIGKRPDASGTERISVPPAALESKEKR